MSKKEQSYRNDDIVNHLEEWFSVEENHNLTREQYQMLRKMVMYMRSKSIKGQKDQAQ